MKMDEFRHGKYLSFIIPAQNAVFRLCKSVDFRALIADLLGCTY
jgi:hypothetical protein